MRLWFEPVGGASRSTGRALSLSFLSISLIAWLLLPAAASRAAEPAPSAGASMTAEQMSSAGWVEHILMKLEGEAVSDITMLPDTPGALEREWRSLDRNGSAFGALLDVLWVVVAASVAVGAEWLVARGLSRRSRRAMRSGPAGVTLTGLLVLLLCDIIGLAVFAAVFIASRHWLLSLGASLNLVLLAANTLIRWRAAVLVLGILLRPRDPVARLVEIPDREALRLSRVLSATILAVVVLVGFGRYGLADEDSGAPHILGLAVAAVVCALYAFMVYRARAVAEALIRGDGQGLAGALRAGVARAWIPIGLTGVAALMLFFVFGLSLELLSYYHAVVSTLGVVFVLFVLEQLGRRATRERAAALGAASDRVAMLVENSFRRILSAVVLLLAAMLLAWIWIDAIEMTDAAASRGLYASAAAVATLFVAYIAWELSRLAIDRHLQANAAGPRLPGEGDEESTPGSRLQTVLPMLRAAFAAVIAVIATLIVLSRLGIDTAPLIAGAGVFGLAISFGSQSLVRDIISGLFYMWDDAFRIGEYIDTGRLKGTVETLGVRSIKVRHHNGPLHTIPYGQLGAVTNLSRDYATIKFNLRLERGSDVELVRKTAKQIGIAMQDEPEIAAEVILPLKMQGIVEVADNAVVFRFKFTARPIKPSWVQREYVKRMYRVFAEKGIEFARGALTLQSLDPLPAVPPNRPAPLLPLPGGRLDEAPTRPEPVQPQTA